MNWKPEMKAYFDCSFRGSNTRDSYGGMRYLHTRATIHTYTSISSVQSRKFKKLTETAAFLRNEKHMKKMKKKKNEPTRMLILNIIALRIVDSIWTIRMSLRCDKFKYPRSMYVQVRKIKRSNNMLNFPLAFKSKVLRHWILTGKQKVWSYKLTKVAEKNHNGHRIALHPKLELIKTTPNHRTVSLKFHENETLNGTSNPYSNINLRLHWVKSILSNSSPFFLFFLY